MFSLKGLENNKFQTHLMKMLLICILMMAIVYLVYITGGTKNVFVQLLYFPIILASLFWGALGGLITGIIGGIASGPFMPLDVSTGIMQEPINWISRLLIYSFIGFITGFMFQRINKLSKDIIERNYKSPFYNLPNGQKLLHEIENKIKLEENFKLLSIKFTNLYEIEKYVDNQLVFDIVNNLANQLKRTCEEITVYSYERDELIVLIRSSCPIDCEEQIKGILEHYFSSPIIIRGYKLRVALKVGIYEYEGTKELPIEIYNKARIAYEQGETKESGIYYYNATIDNRRREIQNITGSLLEAVERNELFVMYQPKIDIVNNKISGVEALVRWKRNGKEMIGPNIFIPIAEEIGFITKISKFVFDNVTTQMKIWEEKGLNIKCSINASIYELIDDDYLKWAKNMIEQKKINEKDIEIEITERAIAYHNKKVLEKMDYLKKRGYQISIDDFGTAYNSLMSISEIPFDKLKIDKYFMDRINQVEMEELIKRLVEYAHIFGKTVIAEGVETEEQLNILKKLHCDEVQGYYFSKPLLPEELEIFYKNFTTTPLWK